jgi:gentisate 1,2-dioxygenase
MVANERGFPTMGTCVLKAEIPVGWHTGKHVHGEESIHILKGEGFSIVDGRRFNWHTGSTLQIPYRAVHQHFNIGNEPVLYLSAMCFPLGHSSSLRASINSRTVARTTLLSLPQCHVKNHST